MTDHSPVDPSALDWTTLSEAVESTGVADRTLRRWIARGLVQGRREESPFGDQWLVDLDEVTELAARKGIGAHRPLAVRGDSQGVDPGQMMVPVDAWRQAMTQMANFAELARDLGEAREAKGRAEQKVETYRERLESMRAEMDSAMSEAPEIATSARGIVERPWPIYYALAVIVGVTILAVSLTAITGH